MLRVPLRTSRCGTTTMMRVECDRTHHTTTSRWCLRWVRGLRKKRKCVHCVILRPEDTIFHARPKTRIRRPPRHLPPTRRTACPVRAFLASAGWVSSFAASKCQHFRLHSTWSPVARRPETNAIKSLVH